MTYTKVEYTCIKCQVTIRGESGDPQEAPWLYCPDCGKRMDYDVDR